MTEKFTDATSDLAIEAYDEGVSNFVTPQKEQEIELIAIIDDLPHLNDLDKYWARSDTEKELNNISLEALPAKVAEIKKKLKFYNFAGQLRADICKRAPGANGETVCDLIDSSILNVSSEGKDRKWKLKELMALDKATQSIEKEKNLTNFIQRKNEIKDSATAKILMMFDAEFSDKFKNFQEEMGAPRFWALSKKMSPTVFPNFTTTFNFRAPRDFLKKLSHKSLPEWPEKLREALMNDAKEILSSEVFDSSRDSKLRDISGAKTVADVISTLLELNNFRDIELNNLDKKKKLENKEKKQTKANEKKEKAEKKSNNATTNAAKIEEKKNKELADKKKREAGEKEKKVDSGSELSAEKQQILQFYEKCIEHAQKVITECPNWGVDANDIDYWGREGVKNRAHNLRKEDNGKKWNQYVKYNSNDPNIPSNARGDGFRFRWLNANTGSSISGAGAESGMKYMQRYKESGYALCVLAGGFSINWSGPDSLAYTPVEYLEKMQALKSGLLGSTAKKTGERIAMSQSSLKAAA